MKTIYIIGSINVDFTTTVNKIPITGETVNGSNFFISFGGKGANQAVACARQGMNPFFIGCVGDDMYGQQIIEKFGQMNINTTHISTVPGSTGSAIIILENDNNRIIVTPGANHDITYANIRNGLKSACDGDILLLQMEIPIDMVEYAIEIAKSKNMILVLNAAPAHHIKPSHYKMIDYLIINEIEAQQLSDSLDLQTAVRNLEKQGVKHVIITMGSLGVMTKSNVIPAYRVKSVDTTAAGDTFVGTLVAKIATQCPLENALLYANAASALSVMKYGAQPSIPKKEEIEKFILNHQSI